MSRSRWIIWKVLSLLLSFFVFGILWMRVHYQESDTFSLIRQELKIWVRVCVDVGLVALSVS